ncbi:Uncharacterised protein [Mycobacteroides abscessus subsp. abscessus]|nr:Uncharacterised protein [Mycobacteroides abscessus subsp. abscessus]
MSNNQFGGTRAEPRHHRPTLLGAQVEGDPHVHAARAEVPVQHAGEVEFVEECGEILQVVGETFRRDGGVFPAGPRLVRRRRIALRIDEPRGQAGAVLADAPQRAASGLVVDERRVDHAPLCA